MSGRLRQTSQQVEDLSLADLSTRLARTLLRLTEIQAIAEGPDSRIRITQRELGRMVGLSRESINRHLRDWEEKGYVALDKGACMIKDWSRLRRFAAPNRS